MTRRRRQKRAAKRVLPTAESAATGLLIVPMPVFLACRPQDENAWGPANRGTPIIPSSCARFGVRTMLGAAARTTGRQGGTSNSCWARWAAAKPTAR